MQLKRPFALNYLSGSSGTGNPTAPTYADLTTLYPDAQIGDRVDVLTTTGTWPTKKKAGTYYLKSAGTWAYYSSLPALSLWDSGRTYALNEKTIGSDGIIYISDTANNTGNNPTTDDGSIWASVVDFNVTQTAIVAKEGRRSWDPESETTVLGMPGGNVSLQDGQEILLPRRAINNSGVDIKNGDLVYITGGTGNNSYIALADNRDTSKSDRTIAMATEDIDDGSRGYCTVFGIVNGDDAQPIDTTAGEVGDDLYLGQDGAFTVNMPEAPNRVVYIGEIYRKHATQGRVLVKINIDKQQMVRDITMEPTGFSSPDGVIIEGDNSTRTITLTGTVDLFYKGNPIQEVVSGWTSDAHGTDTSKEYFLNYDGSDFVWTDASTLDDEFYSRALICLATYDTTNATWIYLREAHGLMQWQAHRADHLNIGTYKTAGGTISNVVLDSTTATERRPYVSSTTLFDEDAKTVNTAFGSTDLSTDGYTQLYINGSDEPIFTTGATDILPLSGSQPQYNNAGTLTVLPNGDYMNAWLIAAPMATDSTSKKYRYTWFTGEEAFDTLAGARLKNPNALNFGNYANLFPEFVIIQQVIVQYLGGNWRIKEINAIEGNKFNLVSVTGGTGVSSFTGLSDTPSSYSGEAGKVATVNATETGLEFTTPMSSVTTDATLTGDGTPSNALGINLSNSNTWTVDQSFEGDVLFPNTTSNLEIADGTATPSATFRIKNSFFTFMSFFSDNSLPSPNSRYISATRTVFGGIFPSASLVTVGVGAANNGFYSFTPNTISVSAGGQDVLRFGDGINPLKTYIDPNGVRGSSTGIWFSDGDTGIFEIADDNIILSVAGSSTYQITSTYFGTVSGNSWSLRNVTVSSTNPTMCPNNVDTDTGIGHAGSDQLSLVAGGVEGVRINTTYIDPVLPIHNLGTLLQSATPTGTTQTIDWNSGSFFTLTTTSATGNITLTLNNPRNGASYAIKAVQGATPRDIIFPTGAKQLGGGGVTVTGAANSTQLITILYDGSNYLISVGTYS